MTTKEALHALIDQLPDDVLPAVEQFLRSVQTSEAERAPAAIPEDDPVWLAFQNAPVDDEPLTEEEIAAIDEAEAELARGEGIPWEVVRERLMRND